MAFRSSAQDREGLAGAGASGSASRPELDAKQGPGSARSLTNQAVSVENCLSIRLLNRETETGMAVYRLAKAGAGWKLSAVDIFEVR